MDDKSHLDNKYFIDPTVYNCPFCNRRHAQLPKLSVIISGYYYGANMLHVSS